MSRLCPSVLGASGADVPGLVPPTWQDVVDREYEPWDRDRLVVDTAVTDVEEGVGAVRQEAVRKSRTARPATSRRSSK
jgi:hypothetical protein